MTVRISTKRNTKLWPPINVAYSNHTCSLLTNVFLSFLHRSKRKVNDKKSSGIMSSKPSTPVAQRRYHESESSRIPISLSPIPFRRTYSMRLRTNCLLNETTLKQHSRNLSQSRAIVDKNQKQLKLNLNYCRRGSLTMDKTPDSNGIDTGESDEVDHVKLLNGNLRRSSFNKNNRGMVCWRHLKTIENSFSGLLPSR